MRPFLEIAERGGLLFDGAMGTLLYERGVFLTRSFEEVNLSQPELVVAIHEEYLHAGAQVLTTNTFGANRMKLAGHGLDEKTADINVAGVRLAQKASGGRAYVAGSVGPTGIRLEDLPRDAGTRAEAALTEQIQLLADAGCDVLCLETFYVLQELELAIRLARACTDLPIVAQLTFQPNARGPQGQTPEQVGRRLIEAGADIIGGNCGGGPELLYDVSTPMVGLGRPVIAQANAGQPQIVEGRQIYVANPEYFGVYGRRLLKAGVKVIGGCCGTQPEHIRRMAGAARMMAAAGENGAPGPRIEGGLGPGELEAARPERPLSERSDLGARLAAGEFVTSVELNPPTGLSLTKKIAAARALQAAGVTTVNIADGPRASLRMGNVAMAVEVERATGMSPIVHVCCRDRSFLGLQSHVLGAHVQGVRNLCVITGDPPKMGDYPHSTGVFDLDSIGLLSVIAGYNHGIDPAGKSTPDQTDFVCATGVEPAALDYDRELRRLEMKRDAGAHFVMTQPVYDPAKVERFLDDAADLGLPILIGLCPLASLRNAVFLHENVPGMQVPPYILDRMKRADEQGAGQAEGVAIAREALEAVRDRVQGAYIMPPFGRYKVAIEVLRGFVDTQEDAAASG
jgi:homocysteine S-methyltransferase